MKNKLFSLILSAFLLMPAGVLAIEDTVQYDEETRQAIEDVIDSQKLDEDNLKVTEEQQPEGITSTPYKTPISKKKLIKKFLIAMFGVAVSSFFLYFGLTLYNRFRSGLPKQIKTPEGETPLETPADLQGAVRSFLNKTKW